MRTIVYPHKIEALKRDKSVAGAPATFGANRGARGTSPNDSELELEPDDYLARLAKRVPAEALGALLLFAGQLQDSAIGWRIAAVLAAGLMAVYLDHDRRKRVRKEIRPRGWIYVVFVVVAYTAWALGTTDLARDLVGVEQAEASFLVAVVALGLGFFEDRIGAQLERA